MTTAHRPTFDPARGREARRGPAYHQRLQPSHTHLKTRQAGQGGIGGLAGAAEGSAQPRDLRAELLAAERAVKARREGKSEEEIAAEARIHAAEAAEAAAAGEEGAEPAGGPQAAVEEDAEQARRRLILEQAAEIDADSTGSASDADSAGTDSDSDGSDSDDEEAELLRELAKIKAERAAARAKEEAARAAAETEAREIEIARGNPLLNGPAQFGVKRRWDDDVVFKNQARGTETRGKEGAFVNDLLRSDFHRRFMSRYVR